VGLASESVAAAALIWTGQLSRSLIPATSLSHSHLARLKSASPMWGKSPGGIPNYGCADPLPSSSALEGPPLSQHEHGEQSRNGAPCLETLSCGSKTRSGREWVDPTCSSFVAAGIELRVVALDSLWLCATRGTSQLTRKLADDRTKDRTCSTTSRHGGATSGVLNLRVIQYGGSRVPGKSHSDLPDCLRKPRRSSWANYRPRNCLSSVSRQGFGDDPALSSMKI
jgi:hypothetical protein